MFSVWLAGKVVLCIDNWLSDGQRWLVIKFGYWLIGWLLGSVTGWLVIRFSYWLVGW